jgi:Cu-Zn family superoxide dismutase
MSDGKQQRGRGRTTVAVAVATVSLAVWAAATPVPPSWAEEPSADCALYEQGTGENGTVAWEVAGYQPEGIGFDPRDCSFYTAASFFRGEIYRGRLDRPGAEVFLPPEADRHSAFGIEIDTKRDLMFVAGGQIGVLYAYDLSDKKLRGRFDTGPGGFLNEVAVAPNGDVYVTDSSRPTLYRIPAAAIEAGSGSPEAIPLGPEVTYGPGVNANGVVVTPDGQHVIFCLTNSGKMYRVTPGAGSARQITEIPIDQGPQTSADGLEIDGHTIYMVRNRDELLVALTMSGRASGRTRSSRHRRRLLSPPTAGCWLPTPSTSTPTGLPTTSSA